MDITQIPFTHLSGLKQEDNFLTLEPLDKVKNHLGTIHASAQFLLAESQCGLFLQEVFPQYKDKVIALLRSSSVKYKKPATTTIRAIASITEEEKEKFLAQFMKKNRALIVVSVEVRDEENELIMFGEFGWFVQGGVQ